MPRAIENAAPIWTFSTSLLLFVVAAVVVDLPVVVVPRAVVPLLPLPLRSLLLYSLLLFCLLFYLFLPFDGDDVGLRLPLPLGRPFAFLCRLLALTSACCTMWLLCCDGCWM